MKRAVLAAWIFVVTALLTALQFRCVFVAHTNTWDWEQGWVVFGPMEVAYGQSDWAQGNGRWLLPHIVRWIAEHWHIQFRVVYHYTVYAAYLAGNLAAYSVLRCTPSTRTFAFLFTVMTGAICVCFQDINILHHCDLVEYTLFFLFAYGVFTHRKWWFFLPLFLVDLNNREVAVFIAAWVALDNLIPFTQDVKRLATGLVAVAACPAGMAYVHWCQRHFTLRTIPPHGNPVKWGQWWAWPENVRGLKQLWPGKPFSCWQPWYNRMDEWAALIGVVLILIVLARFAVIHHDRWFTLRLSALIGAYLLLEVMFGVSIELRTWLALSPFVLFMFLTGRRL
jgi:hypothetical protein